MASSSFLSSNASFYEICTVAAGIAGNLFALVLFMSPIPTFRRIVRNQTVEQFSGLPYLYSLLNCLICFWYGLPFVSYGVLLVATVNSIGAVFQLLYISIFIIHADNAKRVRMCGMLAGVFAVLGLIIYLSLEMFDHQSRRKFNLVIKTKSVEFMPFHLSFATFLMSISFFAYGILLHDFFIYIPNGLGSILGVMQLMLYAYYNKKSREDYTLPFLLP